MFQSLSSRAWLLTIVPALTGIIFAVVVAWLCLNLDGLIRVEVDTARKLTNCQKLADEYLDLLTTGFSSFFKNTSPEFSEERIESCNIQYQKLVRMAKGDNLFLDELKRLDKLHEDFIKSARTYKTEPKTASEKRRYLKDTTFGIGSKLYKILVPVFNILHERSIRSEADEKMLTAQLSYITKIGLLMTLLISLILVHSFSKRVVSRLGVLHDDARCLTQNRPIETKLEGKDEFKQLELNLVALSNELELARRRKQDFLAMISHDLRSPLTSLELMLDMFQEGVYGRTSDETGYGFALHSKNVRRLIQFISDLLDLEKIEARSFLLAKATVEPKSFVSSVVERLMPVAKTVNKEIEFAEGEETGPPFEADRERLDIALSRIITACLEDTAGPVRIRVETIGPGEIFRLAVETQIGGGHDVVPNKIFDHFDLRQDDGILFYQHRHALALARELIRLHGGDIEFVPQPNKARFRIWLNRGGELT